MKGHEGLESEASGRNRLRVGRAPRDGWPMAGDDTKSTTVARRARRPATALMGISATRSLRRDAHQVLSVAVVVGFPVHPSCERRVLRVNLTRNLEQHRWD